MKKRRFRKALKSQSRITYWMWGLLIASGIISAITSEWGNAFMAAVVLTASFLPLWLQKYSGFILPKYFVAAVVFFIIATLFLGEVFDFYNKFWWWDAVLHTGSAVGFGLIGFVFVFSLIGGDRYNASPWIVALLSFAFAVMVGALWEIFEFAMDQIFGLKMQKSGLIDTMWDLIVDSIGAFIAAVSGWYFMRGQRGLSFLTPTIAKFTADNRKQFNKYRSKPTKSKGSH